MIQVFNDKHVLGREAANDATFIINNAIHLKGEANIIVATGASQFEMLKSLVRNPSVDWNKVTMFHLDEYIGLPISHPASFRKYLQERFIDKVKPLKEVYLINGEAENPVAECKRLGNIIAKIDIDLAFVGFGENGHIAFNDPPADFDTDEPYIVVELDEACRKQQYGEGWFPDFDSVPKKAISMSVRQIMKSKNIICCVPDKRKAEAVKNCIEQEVSNQYPASILQRHPSCKYYFDEGSASLLNIARR